MIKMTIFTAKFFVLLLFGTNIALAQTTCDQLTGTQKEECIRQRNLERQRRIAAARRDAQIRDSLQQIAAKPPVVAAPTPVTPVNPIPSSVRLDDGPNVVVPPPVNLPVASSPNPSPNPTVPTQEAVEVPEIYDAVTEMPSPIGGMRAIGHRIVYPNAAKRMGIEGVVVVQMVIDELGRPSDFVIFKGIQGGCNDEAIRVLKETRFLPGVQDGKPVKVRLTLPIRFELQ